MTTATVNGVHTDAAADAHKQYLADGKACLEAALEYLKLGWSPLCVCPPSHVGVGKVHANSCSSPGKAPFGPWKEFYDRCATEDELRRKWQDLPLGNVGLALGPVSGLIRVDVDGAGGETRLQELSRGDLPATLEFTSGNGRGLLFAIPAGVTLRTTYEQQGTKQELRLQAKGAQTVLPPSRHPSGRLYTWRTGLGPSEMKAAQAPAWLVYELRETKGKPKQKESPAGNPNAAPTTPEGGRHTLLTSLAGSMRSRGFCQEAIEAALQIQNVKQCDPPLDESEVSTIAAYISTAYAPGAWASSIIFAYMKQRYAPTHRVGGALYSSTLGREVRKTEACGGAPTDLIEQLSVAVGAPKHGNLPNFYKTWAPTAWADLHRGLPDEEDAGELAEMAADEFRRAVASVLTHLVKLGQVSNDNNDQSEERVETRSLLDWCFRFSRHPTGGTWQNIRSFRVWFNKGEDNKLRVALRHELFGQVGAHKLASMPAAKFSRLAVRYGVAVQRVAKMEHGAVRAVELSPDFLRSVAETPNEIIPSDGGQADNESPAHARDKSAVHLSA